MEVQSFSKIAGGQQRRARPLGIAGLLPAGESWSNTQDVIGTIVRRVQELYAAGVAREATGRNDR
jgi:hypothetical protein